MLDMVIYKRLYMLAACGPLAAGLALVPTDTRAESGLCSIPERAIFSCAIGTKEVSVCASDNLAEMSGTIQYRFGRLSQAELAYPPEGGDWRAVTRGGILAFSGGGGAFLAFDRSPYRYVVYTAVGQGWGSKSGVVVERSGKRIANLKCSTEAKSELGPALFSRAGIRPFEESFELP